MFLCMYYVVAFCLSSHRWTDELFQWETIYMLPTIPLWYVSEQREGPPSGLGGTAFWERWEGDSVLQDVWHLWELNASSEHPWWFSGQESTCQCRDGYNPWSGKIPHAAEHLGPCTTTAESVLQSPRARPQQKEKLLQ